MIHTMSKEYRGGAAPAVLRKTTTTPVVAIPVAQPKPVPKPVPAPSPSVKPLQAGAARAEKNLIPYVVLSLGVFLMLISGIVIYVAYGQMQKSKTEVAIVPPPVPEPAPLPPVTPPVAVPAPVPVPEPPKKPGPGVDSDSDGLTDVEELRLYNTLIYTPDTDGDSFLDGNEVFHLYDPLKVDFARIIDSGFVKLYTQPLSKYKVFVPASFVANEDTNGLLTTWSIPSGENISVTAYPNFEKTPLRDWFAAQFPARASETMTAFTSKSGTVGIQSESRLETFLEGNGMIYKIEYSLGSAKAIEYRQTYAMMLNSFVAE